jgi:hypothetical protein
MQIDGVDVVHGRVVTANIETSPTLPTDKLSNGRIVYLTQTDLGNVPGLYVYSSSNWEIVTNSGFITSVTAGNGLLGGGNSGAVTLDVDTTVIATVASLNSKLNTTGGSVTGNIDMNNNSIVNVSTPLTSTSVTNKQYVDDADAFKLSKAGDTMSGNLDMGSNLISNISTPVSGNDAANKTYVDDVVNLIQQDVDAINLDLSAKVSKSGDTMTGILDMGSNLISNVSTPISGSDAANKTYVDATNPVNYPNSTTNSDGESFIVSDSSDILRKLLKTSINVSGFNNDANYITTTLTSAINYTPDTGGVLTFDGVNIISRSAAGAVSFGNTQTTIISGGDNSKSLMETNASIIDEDVIIGADDNVIIYNSMGGLFANRNELIFSGSSLTLNGNTVWHQGNQGTGSGLDADTVDGIDSTQFVRTDLVTTMFADLDLGNNSILNLAAPVNLTDAVNKEYVDNLVISYGSTFDDGTVLLPSITFTNDNTTGIYRPAGNQLGITVGGVNRVNVSTTYLTSTLPAVIPIGSSVVPSLTFTGDLDTGIYSTGANDISLTTSGVQRLSVNTTSVTSSLPVYAPFGTQSAPGYSFTSSPSTGIYVAGATNDVRVSVNGVSRFTVYDTGVVSGIDVTADKITNYAGLVGAPSYTFSTDTTSGLYSISSGNLGVTTNGVLRATFNSSGLTINSGGILDVSGSSTNPSYSFTSDPDTGIYNLTSNTLGFTTGGVLRVTVDNSNTTLTNTMRAPSGSVSDAAYGFTGQTGIGMWASGTDLNLVGSTGMLLGSNLISLNSNVAVSSQLRNSNGSFGTPSYSFTNDLTTGMYRSSSNEIGFSTGGAARVIMSNTQARFRSVNISMETGGVVQSTNGTSSIPGFGFASEVNTGMYTPSSGVLSFTTLGTQRLSVSSSGVDVNSLKVINVATPTVGTDAANKAYVDGVATGLDLKSSVKVATTANITLSGTQTIDGVAVVAADRVLVKNQSTASENGIYDVESGAWTRTGDADNTPSGEVTTGMFCFVEQGTANAGAGYVLTTVNPITLGVTSLSFTQFSSSAAYIQGTGINISGNTIALDTTYTDSIYVNTAGDTMSGVLSVIGGTSGAPGLSFSGDTDTGLYSTTANLLGLSTNGSPCLTMSSVVGNITASLPIIGVVGSASIPTYTFSGSTNTGIYSSTANEISFSSSSSQRVKINTSGMYVTNVLGISNGSVASPSLSFTSFPTTGVYASAANEMSFAASGVKIMSVHSSGLYNFGSMYGTGTVSSPAYTFISNSNSGMYSVSTGVVGVSASGSLRLSISATDVTSTVPFYGSAGLASAPSISFSGDTNTGMYSYSADVIGFAANGNHMLRMSASGGLLVDSIGVRSISGSASAPVYSFNPNTTSGMYQSATNEVAFATNGVQRVKITDTSLSVINGTPSLPSLSYSSETNTGTYLLSSGIIGFSTLGTQRMTVSANGLDMNSNKVIGVATPTATTDAANKAYVDGVANGLGLKSSVRAATTANITLSGTQTIDGVAVVASNRVLVKNQSTGSENGIYVAAAGSWSRSSDTDVSSEVTTGIFCFVEEGTINAGKGYVLTTANPIVLGTTSLSFTQFSSINSYTQGTGINISGNTIALDTSYTDTRYVNTTGDSMSGGLSIIRGTVATPGLNFAADTGTGIYQVSDGDFNIAIAGTNRLTVTGSAITSSVAYVAPSGSFSNPSYTFAGNTNTGLYNPAANIIGFSTNNGLRAQIHDSAVQSFVPYYAPNGLASAPAYSFGSESNTGIYRSTAGQLSISILGTTRVNINSTEVSVGNLKVTNVATPTSGTDAANKSYVDSVSGRVQVVVSKAAHGFTSGTPIYFNGTIWVSAQADSNVTISTHIVEVIDSNNFYAVNCGNVTMTGLIAGSWYFTSESVLGTITTTEPVTGFSNPVGQALSTTILMVMPLRAQGV